MFLTKKSPIMENARKATDCYRAGIDYYLTDKQVEEALADSVELKAGNIPTNRLKDDNVTVYAFGDIAEQYGNFLKDAGIKEIPVWLAIFKDRPFARQVWFENLNHGSELNGIGWGLHCNRVRGIKGSIEAHL